MEERGCGWSEWLEELESESVSMGEEEGVEDEEEDEEEEEEEESVELEVEVIDAAVIGSSFCSALISSSPGRVMT